MICGPVLDTKIYGGEIYHVSASKAIECQWGRDLGAMVYGVENRVQKWEYFFQELNVFFFRKMATMQKNGLEYHNLLYVIP